jgi:hypothetical protein
LGLDLYRLAIAKEFFRLGIELEFAEFQPSITNGAHLLLIS